MIVRTTFVRSFAVALLAMAGMLLAACGTATPTDPVDLVPARANLIGSIDLAALLTDPDVAEMYALLAESSDDPEMPATIEELLLKAEELSGLDLTTFGEALVFADIADAGESDVDFVALVAAGAPDGLFEKVRETADVDLAETEYNGIAVLESVDDDMAIAVVDGAAVAGSRAGVQAAIDVAQGDAEAIDGELLAFYEGLGDVWLKVALVPPASIVEEAEGADLGLPVDISSILEMDAIGVVATKEGTDGVLRLVLRYETAEQADSIQSAVNSLLSLLTVFGGDDPSLEMLDKLDIRAEATDVVVEVREDMEEAKQSLRDMLGSFGEMSPFGT